MERSETDCNPPEYLQTLLDDKEKEYFKKRKETYLKAYPYLKEPAMELLLGELIFMELRMRRLNERVFANTAIIAEKNELDGLRRTFVLYLTRMGISYISRERRKEKPKKQSPLEKLTEE